MILMDKSVNNSTHIMSLPHQGAILYTVLVTWKWVLQSAQRHWTVCSNPCRLLHGKESRANKRLITVVDTAIGHCAAMQV